MSMDANDRDQIVRLSSDFSIPGYHPPAIGADKLYLTALGAWMDVLGDFDRDDQVVVPSEIVGNRPDAAEHVERGPADPHCR